MDTPQGIDNLPPQQETASIFKRFKEWRERGFSEDAVAVYGMSTENFRRIMQTGQIPPSPHQENIPYQKELADKGKLLYFCLPFRNALHLRNFYLYQEMEKVLGVNSGYLEAEEQIETAAIYAHHRAFDERYTALTGEQELDDGVRTLLDSKYVYKEELIPEEEKKISDEVERLKKRGIDLMDVFKDANSRKGILLYLNKSIFEYYLSQTPEDETELVIATDKPLTIDIISGIQILSEHEDEELKKIYEI